jgi:hypothetical protein
MVLSVKHEVRLTPFGDKKHSEQSLSVLGEFQLSLNSTCFVANQLQAILFHFDMRTANVCEPCCQSAVAWLVLFTKVHSKSITYVLVERWC